MQDTHEKTASPIVASLPQRHRLLIMFLAITVVVLVTATAHAEVTDWEDLIALSIDLYQQGEYVNSLNTMRESIEVAKKTFGPDHHTVSISMKNLALLYRMGGNYSEAEMLYKKAISLEEKILGRDHFLVAEDLRTLAELYKFQGKDNEAESLYKRAHVIEEEFSIKKR